jgi:hypothetical protein
VCDAASHRRQGCRQAFEPERTDPLFELLFAPEPPIVSQRQLQAAKWHASTQPIIDIAKTAEDPDARVRILSVLHNINTQPRIRQRFRTDALLTIIREGLPAPPPVALAPALPPVPALRDPMSLIVQLAPGANVPRQGKFGNMFHEALKTSGYVVLYATQWRQKLASWARRSSYLNLEKRPKWSNEPDPVSIRHLWIHIDGVPQGPSKFDVWRDKKYHWELNAQENALYLPNL